MAIGTYISIITLKKNVLNVPSKRHRLAEKIPTNKQTNKNKTKQNKAHIYVVYKKPISDLKILQTESERMEKYIL